MANSKSKLRTAGTSEFNVVLALEGPASVLFVAGGVSFLLVPLRRGRLLESRIAVELALRFLGLGGACGEVATLPIERTRERVTAGIE